MHLPRLVLALLLAASPALAENPPPAAPAADSAAPAAGQDARADAAPLIPFEKSSLANGLEVIVHRDPRLPVVCVSVWYHVGAFHEEPGRTGFAHLFEHLMFQGTPNVPGDSHIKLLEAAGGSFMNGTTDFDRTNYFECVPRNEIELALWLESDRMAYLMKGTSQAKLDEQRNVVKNERRQSVENRPYGLAEEKLWQAMFPKTHPYWGYVIGSMEDLDRASLADVSSFYDNYYAPSNATLSLVGDVEPLEAKMLVAKYFDSLPKWPKPPARTVEPPRLAGDLRVDAEDAVAQLPKVTLQYFTPAAYQPDNAELNVLAYVLGDGNNSRLHQALIVDSQLAQEISATHQDLGNVSVLTLSAVVKPGGVPEDVLNALQAQLDLLNDLPPSPEELVRAVNSIEARTVFELQLPLARGELLQHFNHFTGDPGYLEKNLARFRAVTPETIQAAVNKHLGKDRRAVLVVQPKGSAPSPSPSPAAPSADAPKETK